MKEKNYRSGINVSLNNSCKPIQFSQKLEKSQHYTVILCLFNNKTCCVKNLCV